MKISWGFDKSLSGSRSLDWFDSTYVAYINIEICIIAEEQYVITTQYNFLKII